MTGLTPLQRGALRTLVDMRGGRISDTDVIEVLHHLRGKMVGDTASLAADGS